MQSAFWRNEGVQCTVCLDNFDDPRVLACGHTFCLACLQRLTKSDKLNCPLCQQQSVVPDADITRLPKNFTLISALACLLETRRDNEAENAEQIVLTCGKYKKSVRKLEHGLQIVRKKAEKLVREVQHYSTSLLGGNKDKTQVGELDRFFRKLQSDTEELRRLLETVDQEAAFLKSLQSDQPVNSGGNLVSASQLEQLVDCVQEAATGLQAQINWFTLQQALRILDTSFTIVQSEEDRSLKQRFQAKLGRIRGRSAGQLSGVSQFLVTTVRKKLTDAMAAVLVYLGFSILRLLCRISPILPNCFPYKRHLVWLNFLLFTVGKFPH